MDNGAFLHDHKGHQIKDFPGERGWVGVFCPDRVAAKVRKVYQVVRAHQDTKKIMSIKMFHALKTA